MLSDRDYMYRDVRAGIARQGINTVWVLIALNVLCYLVLPPDSIFSKIYGTQIIQIDFASPYAKMALWASGSHFQVWQLVSNMFLHGSFMHLFFNMYGLYLFGMLVAPILGRTKFVALYFVSGIVGSLLWLAANWNGNSYAVGASGALFGVMLAVAMLRPNQQFMMLFFPVPIRATTMVVVYAVVEILSELGRSDNIAHLAHLGGFLGAYCFLKFFCKRDIIWDLTDLFRRRGPHMYNPPPQGGKNPFSFRFSKPFQSGSSETSGSGNDAPPPPITHVSQREVDLLLDKISRLGVNSLTPEERAKLEYFRSQMRSRH